MKVSILYQQEKTQMQVFLNVTGQNSELTLIIIIFRFRVGIFCFIKMS